MQAYPYSQCLVGTVALPLKPSTCCLCVDDWTYTFTLNGVAEPYYVVLLNKGSSNRQEVKLLKDILQTVTTYTDVGVNNQQQPTRDRLRPIKLSHTAAAAAPAAAAAATALVADGGLGGVVRRMFHRGVSSSSSDSSSIGRTAGSAEAVVAKQPGDKLAATLLSAGASLGARLMAASAHTADGMNRKADLMCSHGPRLPARPVRVSFTIKALLRLGTVAAGVFAFAVGSFITAALRGSGLVAPVAAKLIHAVARWSGVAYLAHASGVSTVCHAALAAAEDVLSSSSQALQILLGGAQHASQTLIAHWYGQDAAAAAGRVFQMAGSALQVYLHLQRLRPTSLMRNVLAVGTNFRAVTVALPLPHSLHPASYTDAVMRDGEQKRGNRVQSPQQLLLQQQLQQQRYEAAGATAEVPSFYPHTPKPSGTARPPPTYKVIESQPPGKEMEVPSAPPMPFMEADANTIAKSLVDQRG
ncbi:MAG: hypothetical protein WDW36_000455 [Sanguina aurantia]